MLKCLHRENEYPNAFEREMNTQLPSKRKTNSIFKGKIDMNMDSKGTCVLKCLQRENSHSNTFKWKLATQIPSKGKRALKCIQRNKMNTKVSPKGNGILKYP